MPTTRVFLLASSISRVIARERSGETITEGFFPDSRNRTMFVQLRGDSADLHLISDEPSRPAEAAAIPSAFAQALLAVVAGQLEYNRTRLLIGDADVWVNQYQGEGSVATVQIDFLDQALADIFQAPS